MTDEKDKNLLSNNIFTVKVNTKEGSKDIELKPYSFSVQLKLMESGLLNELMNLSTVVNEDQQKNKIDAKKMDFRKLGSLLRVAIQIIFEMLPKDIQIVSTIEKFTDDIVDGEPMRFINWVMEQFGKTNAFLTLAPKEGAGQLGQNQSVVK